MNADLYLSKAGQGSLHSFYINRLRSAFQNVFGMEWNAMQCSTMKWNAMERNRTKKKYHIHCTYLE